MKSGLKLFRSVTVAIGSFFGVAAMSALADTKVADSEAQARWAFSYENDFFVPGTRDQDYTYGFSLSYSDVDADSQLLGAPISALDSLANLRSKKACSGIEVGMYGFTPEDITESVANQDDRPFSSLLYTGASSIRITDSGRSVWRSKLTVGLLGLRVVGDIQKQTHKLLEGDTPAGWRHQISDGGELTARYSLSRQQLVYLGRRFELRHTASASVGYITEASWGISFRAGRVNSRWYSFNPEIASYAEGSANVNRSVKEWFFWGGFTAKARAYNVFLQGQFKDSVVTYQADELNHLILEGWVGVTAVFNNDYFASYSIRGHTSEVQVGNADRPVVWGGLSFGKTFGS